MNKHQKKSISGQSYEVGLRKNLTKSHFVNFVKFAVLAAGILFLPGALLFAPQKTEAAAWYDTSWSFRKSITLDSAKVSSTLTDFPVLINVATSTNWKTTANGGSVGKDDGTDILFTSSDGATKLSHEIERYNSSTGELVAWVKIPSLSDTVSTTIYIYYGNASAADQQSVTSTWSNGFAGVWHLKEATGATSTDSTVNANNGTSSGTSIPVATSTGKIAGAQDFDGVNDFINVSNSTSIGITGAMTISGWALLDTFAAVSNIISRNTPAPNRGYFFRFSTAGIGQFSVTADGSVEFTVTTAAAVGTSTWVYLVGTYEPSVATKIYKNGAFDTSNTTAVPASQFNNGLGAPIGARINATFPLDGQIDEVRISNALRSSGWILTEYNNQNSPSAFYSVGTQENALIISGHPSGQEPDKFTTSTSVTSTELFVFTLAANGENASVSTTTLSLSAITGIATADITNPALFIDKNRNGNIDASEIAQVGGTGTVNITGTTGTIAFSQSYLAYQTSTMDATKDQTFLDPDNVASDQFGFSLAIGDVNADGFADVLVGCRFCDNGATINTGKAFLYFGGPNGIDAAVDKIFLSPDDAESDNFGTFLAVGDVNGDGFSDVLIGCQLCDNGATINTGKAFLYFGASGTTMDTSTDKTFLDPDNVAGDNFGVSAVGDVNGDGFSDVLIGCENCDNGATINTGKAFLYFGASGTTMDTSTDKTFLDPDNVAGDNFGASAVGDVNGDGFGDVLVGCWSCDNGATTSTGKTFLYFGASGTAMDTSTDKTFLDPDNVAGDNFGALLAVGDVNGDGFVDILVGCQSCDNGATTDTGKAFLYFGASGTTMDTSTDKTFLDPDNVGSDRFGASVAVGDVNGDGFSDVLIGCKLCDSGATINTGKAFLWFGATGTTMDTSTDKTFLDPDNVAGDFFSASAVGDVNGDGFSDVLIGCELCNNGATTDTGKAFLFQSDTKPQSYIMKADVANLVGGDTLTIGFSTSSSAATGASSSAAMVITGSVLTATHTEDGGPAFTQRNYRWFNNQDSLLPGANKAALNSSINNVSNQDVNRLRIDVSVAAANLAAASQPFKLQFKTLGAGCAAAETWTDVGNLTSTAIWRGFNNPATADGAALTGGALLDSVNILQSYEEQNNSASNPNAINTGQAGEWDWLMQDNQAVNNTTYCFRMVKSDGVAFGTYTNYPQIITQPSAAVQGGGGGSGATDGSGGGTPTTGGTQQGAGATSTGGSGGGTPTTGGTQQGGGPGPSTFLDRLSNFFASLLALLRPLFSIFGS